MASLWGDIMHAILLTNGQMLIPSPDIEEGVGCMIAINRNDPRYSEWLPHALPPVGFDNLVYIGPRRYISNAD